jgi:hypothetical protein
VRSMAILTSVPHIHAIPYTISPPLRSRPAGLLEANWVRASFSPVRGLVGRVFSSIGIASLLRLQSVVGAAATRTSANQFLVENAVMLCADVPIPLLCGVTCLFGVLSRPCMLILQRTLCCRRVVVGLTGVVLRIDLQDFATGSLPSVFSTIFLTR